MSTSTKNSSLARTSFFIATLPTVVVALLTGAVGMYVVQQRFGGALSPSQQSAGETTAAHDDHDDHAHGGSDSLELSVQARKNIGLQVQEIKLQTFVRTKSVPAMVVERPGRTKFQVAAPITGVITGIRCIKGETVGPGKVLFSIRLTHKDLVQAQASFLQTLGELDVENREIDRLEAYTGKGVVPGKLLLDRQYAKQKLEAVLSAHREALQLHGLSESQVARIVNTRKLFREMLVMAPGARDDGIDPTPISRLEQPLVPATLEKQAGSGDSTPRRFVVHDLNVNEGQSVQAGDSLCVLADLSELFIEGRAFEHDADELQEAANKGWRINAVLEGNRQQVEEISGLKLIYVANEVEPESRALHFYVALPNRVVRDTVTPDGHRFVGWKFRPGQRLQLQIPVEHWPERIVLPVGAIVQEGTEYFVFQENGKFFQRREVHVEHRNQSWAVIANDGSLYPGDVVAVSGAHQMQMALKNKAGGGAGGHAGHGHPH